MISASAAVLSNQQKLHGPTQDTFIPCMHAAYLSDKPMLCANRNQACARVQKNFVTSSQC